MKRYFKKEIANRPLILSNGKQAGYSFIIDNTGLIEIDDEQNAALALELSSIQGRFGVSELTDAQADAFKKKYPSPRRAQQSPAPRLYEAQKDPFKNRQPSKQVIKAGEQVAVPLQKNIVKPQESQEILGEVRKLQQQVAQMYAKRAAAAENVAPVAVTKTVVPVKEQAQSQDLPENKPRRGRPRKVVEPTPKE